MRVAVCYPQDYSVPAMPFGALPLFNACLRSAGHQTLLLDVAALSFGALIRRERVAFYLDLLERSYEAELAKGPAADVGLLEGLARLRAVPRELVLSAEEAARRLRDPETYFDPERLRTDQEALLAVVQLFDIVCPRFDPRNEGFADDFYAWFDRDDPSDPWGLCYEELVRPRLDAFRPELVALTVPFGMQLADAMRFARWVRRRDPSVRIVAGGTGISDGEEAVLDPRFFQAFDYVVTGDGEEALVELAHALESGGDVADVPSLYRLEEGRVVRPSVRRFADMDRTPTPDYDGVDWSVYLSPERIASLTTSRGCYYGKCAFCPESFRLDFRRRASDEVWNDVRTIATEQGVDNFMFWDPLTPPAALERVAVGVRSEGLDVHWMAQVKFDEAYADRGYVETLRDGGCEYLQFGFESGVQRVLDDMGKGNDLERVGRITERMAELGLGVSVTFFIGFPTELEDDARETWRYLVRERHRIQFAAYIGPFGVYKDLPLYRNPEHYGVDIVTAPDGLLRCERRDGKDWDLEDLDATYRVRNDINAIESGALLLYHRRRRDLLPRIATRTADGPPTFVRGDLLAVVLEPAPTNGESTLAHAGEERHFAYVGASNRMVAIDAEELRVVEAVRALGPIEVAALPDGLDPRAVRRAIDRGLVRSSPMADATDRGDSHRRRGAVPA